MNALRVTTRYVVAVAVWALLLPSVGRTAHAAPTECDRLAAAPTDPSKPSEIPGVRPDDINGPLAVTACALEAAKWPNDARIQYQYGRALFANKQYLNAGEQYLKAARMGSVSAMNNYGYLLSEGLGYQKNKPLALQWYEFAARSGFTIAQRNAAFMLESGEGLPEKNLGAAASYWRMLAKSGDAEAAERVGMFIKEGKVAPTAPKEAFQWLSFASDRRKILAAVGLAELTLGAEYTPAEKAVGVRAAYAALQMYRSASPTSFDGWPVYEWHSARMLVKLVKEGAPSPVSAGEITLLDRDFAYEGLVVTLPIKCTDGDTQAFFYVWDWPREESPVAKQFAWYERVKGCVPSQDVKEWFASLYQSARKSNVSYKDLLVYANSDAAGRKAIEDEQKRRAGAAQAGATAQSGGPSNGQVAAGFLLGMICLAIEKCRDTAFTIGKHLVLEKALEAVAK